MQAFLIAQLVDDRVPFTSFILSLQDKWSYRRRLKGKDFKNIEMNS